MELTNYRPISIIPIQSEICQNEFYIRMYISSGIKETCYTNINMQIRLAYLYPQSAKKPRDTPFRSADNKL